jgi:hypothetical protein
MVFVYLLAAIGLVSLIVLATAAIGDTRDPGSPASADPFDAAVNAAAELNAEAWKAIHELRELNSERER